MNETKPWKLYLNEYISENLVYAVRYLTMREIRKEEKYLNVTLHLPKWDLSSTNHLRLWWILWLGASLAACIFSMVTMYERWDADPVTIVYGSDLMPVSTVPFPAVTICPLSKSRADMINLTWALETTNGNGTMLDGDIEAKLRALAHVCDFQTSLKKVVSERKERTVENLRIMAQPLETLMVHCWWRSRVIPCKNIMMEQLVDDGICYTFNSLALDEIYRKDQISPDFLNFSNIPPSSDWTHEGGYRTGAGLNAYPHRPLSSGIISGVIFAMSVNRIDQEPLCLGAHAGFKFAIHAPDVIPLTGDRFYRLNNKSAAFVTVSPLVSKASERLRSIDPVKRKCFYADENPLQFFRHYNHMNCFVECVANLTLMKCGCVKFSMPRLVDTKICDVDKIDCYHNAINELFELFVKAKLAGNTFFFCHCLPACSSVRYEVGYTQTPIKDFPFKLDFLRDNMDPGLMFVSIRERHYFPLWRMEQMGFNQAVAQLGGLFALLMGSSMLSLAEVVYYCCVRRLRRDLPRRKQRNNTQRVRSRGHRIHLRIDPYARKQNQQQI